jgi:hypothetical protein
MQVSHVDVGSILLDERNPRIAHATEPLASGVDQEWIKLALGQAAPDDEERGGSTTYSSLKASIRAHGGLINPIIVTENGDGSYTVIEGNTRVAIYRELAEEDAPGDWSTIPAIVQKEIDEQGQHAIRLQAHLVGPRPWRPYAKAKYLHDLYMNKKLSITELLDFCGGTARRREIENYIAAYKDMQETYMPLATEAGAPPDYTSFSSFVELQNIKQALLRMNYTPKDFAKWVFEGKLSPQQTVRQLPRILANTEARTKFFQHNAREALRVLDQPNPNSVLNNVSLDQLATALTVKIRQLNWSEVQALRAEPQDPTSVAVTGCYDELKALVDMLSSTVDA